MNTENTFQMSGEENMEARIWEYIDGLLQGQELSEVEQLIAGQAEWKKKYAELFALHQSLNLVELEQPSLRFTRNVMEEISRLQITPATSKYINKNVIRGIALFFITTIVAFLVYGISQVDWSTGSSGSVVGVDFTRVDYTRVFNNNFVNAFMMLNVVLGLMLLDRYLANKKKSWQQNTL